MVVVTASDDTTLPPADAWMQKGGKLDEAFRALKEFADLCPDQDDIRLMLADQFAKKNRKGEAIEQLQGAPLPASMTKLLGGKLRTPFATSAQAMTTLLGDGSP